MKEVLNIRHSYLHQLQHRHPPQRLLKRLRDITRSIYLRIKRTAKKRTVWMRFWIRARNALEISITNCDVTTWSWVNLVAVAAACRIALVNDGWAICLLSYTNGCRKRSFHLVGTPFLPIRQFLVGRNVIQ